MLNQEVYSQVKIYDKTKQKTILQLSLNLYKSTKSSDAEVLTSLKGTTYNFVNGKVEADKVEKEDKFKSKESKTTKFLSLHFLM